MINHKIKKPNRLISDISESAYTRVTYFYRLLLVVTLGIPVMPRVNRDLKLIQMCIFCKQHKSKHSSVQTAEVLPSDNRIRVLPPGSHIQTIQGQRVRSCLHVRPKQGEVCLTVSDLGGGLISHPWWGVRRPCAFVTIFLAKITSIYLNLSKLCPKYCRSLFSRTRHFSMTSQLRHHYVVSSLSCKYCCDILQVLL